MTTVRVKHSSGTATGSIQFVNSPYTATGTDNFAMIFEDTIADPSGIALEVRMPPNPTVGQQFGAVWWTTATGAAPPRIKGGTGASGQAGGYFTEDINNPGVMVAGATGTVLTNPTQRAQWEFVGSDIGWVLTPGS